MFESKFSLVFSNSKFGYFSALRYKNFHDYKLSVPTYFDEEFIKVNYNKKNFVDSVPL